MELEINKWKQIYTGLIKSTYSLSLSISYVLEIPSTGTPIIPQELLSLPRPISLSYLSSFPSNEGPRKPVSLGKHPSDTLLSFLVKIKQVWSQC